MSMGSHLDFHQSSFKTSLLKLKEKEVMTDVSLTLPDQSAIPCHKVILMAASPFFETMFQSGLKEDAEEGIQLYFADADTIRMVVDFFYTGEIEVTADNVKAMVAASDFLCCSHLNAHCEEFLANQGGSENCVDLHRFSKMFNLGVLLVTTFDFILGHFKDFMGILDYETLTEDELVEVVSNDGLNVENEDVVFEAVTHWVNADLDLRKDAFPRIAPLIRFPFCTASTLNFNVCQNDLMLKSGCIELAHEALRSQYHCRSAVIHNPRCIPRCSFKGKKQRLVRLGFEKNSLNPTLDYTDRIDGGVVNWNLCDNTCAYSWEIQSVTCPAGLYFGVGGRKCYLFASEITKVTEMPWKSPKSPSVFIDGRIFAFGGYYQLTSVVESLNLTELNPEWKPEQEMLLALKHSLVVHCANRVYVFGGYTKDGPSNVTQEFDPVRGKWRLRCEMPEPCEHTAAVALNDKIFVFGGKERVAYSYDPAGDEWKVLSQPTQVFDSYVTATTWYGHILVADQLHVEEYDPVKDTWSPCDQLTRDHGYAFKLLSLHTLCF